MTDGSKPLTEEELAEVDDWIADCKEADLRHGVRMRRLLDELRRLRGRIHKLKEQLIAAGGRPDEAIPTFSPTDASAYKAGASMACLPATAFAGAAGPLRNALWLARGVASFGLRQRW